MNIYGPIDTTNLRFGKGWGNQINFLGIVPSQFPRNRVNANSSNRGNDDRLPIVIVNVLQARGKNMDAFLLKKHTRAIYLMFHFCT